MKKQTRLLAVFICLIMLFSFAGCGNSDQTSSDDQNLNNDTGVLIDDFEDETVPGTQGDGSDVQGTNSGGGNI